jgi:hypothetical protein
VHVLEGSRAKIARAREHFELLKDELRTAPEDGRFWKANPNPFEAKIEREGMEHALYLRLREEPDLVRWGLLLGDGMHNLRCALDLAVYDLAIRASGEDPPPQKRSLQFPITDSDEKWTDAKRRIEPLADDAKRVIHDAQPYKRGNDLATSPLRLLRELDDADKHRLIAPGVFAISQGRIRWEPPIVPLAYEIPDPGESLKNNTKIAWVLFSKPQPDVKVNFRMTLEVGVRHEATKEGFTWTRIGEVIAKVGDEVQRIVLDLEAVS